MSVLQRSLPAPPRIPSKQPILTGGVCSTNTQYNLAQSTVRRNLYPELLESKDALPLGAKIICGAASGAFASFILTPIELIKCKMQVQAMSPAVAGVVRPGPLKLVGQVYRTYGMRGFWNGQMGTFLRETGGGAAWFGSYEYVSALLRKRKGSETLGAGEMMLAGAAGRFLSGAREVRMANGWV